MLDQQIGKEAMMKPDIIVKLPRVWMLSVLDGLLPGRMGHSAVAAGGQAGDQLKEASCAYQ